MRLVRPRVRYEVIRESVALAKLLNPIPCLPSEARPKSAWRTVVMLEAVA